MHFRFGPFTLDTGTRQLCRGPAEVRLTPKAFELLRLLVENRPRALAKSELTEHLWPGVHVTDDGLPRLINEIRLALGETAREPHWIRTVHGFGYAFGARTENTEAPHEGYRLTWSGREFQLDEGEHVIGRDPSVAIRLEAPQISRRHARIVVDGGRARIEDLDSKNGTYVGEERLHGARDLRDGEEIRVGDLTLTFRATLSLPTETVQ